MQTISNNDTMSGLKSSAQHVRSAANDATEGAKQDLREMANHAGRKVRDFIHTANDEITQARDTVTTQIRSNPVQSSAIALGVGIVLGALLRR